MDDVGRCWTMLDDLDDLDDCGRCLSTLVFLDLWYVGLLVLWLSGLFDLWVPFFVVLLNTGIICNTVAFGVYLNIIGLCVL